MVIRGHGHDLVIHFVADGIICHIGNDIDIQAAHAFLDQALALSCTKSGAIGLDEKAVAVTAWNGVKLPIRVVFQTVPFQQPGVDHFSDLFTPVHCNYPKRSVWYLIQILRPRYNRARHVYPPENYIMT